MAILYISYHFNGAYMRNDSIEGGFVIEDGVLVFYKGSAQTLAVPSYVTSIGEGAFAGRLCLYSESLPEGLISIGEEALYECESLSSVSLPATLAGIGDGSFMMCWCLISIYLPEGLTGTGDREF